VWGLAGPDAVAVRVIDTAGGVTSGPVVGPDLDGSSAFAVEMPPRAQPDQIEVIGREGPIARREAGLPAPKDTSGVAARIDVRATDRDLGRGGTVVYEGRVDEATWAYTIEIGAGQFRQHFALEGEGVVRSTASGPVPRPEPGRWLTLTRSGESGRFWHFQGWAAMTVTSVTVHLESGERLEVPTTGHQLDLGFVVFALALPEDVQVLALDALDAGGARLARVHTRARPIGTGRHRFGP
jgi:hypothetical protein